MKKPSVDDMYTAARWLEIYMGAEDADSCQRVAAWLKSEADKAELEANAKLVAKQTGRTVSECRARLRQMR